VHGLDRHAHPAHPLRAALEKNEVTTETRRARRRISPNSVFSVSILKML
jgi:hypothetical protein